MQQAKRVLLQDGDFVWPYFHNLYSFFGRRSRKLTVFSYGFDNGAWEAEIAENTGCKVNIFDSRPSAKERFENTQRILKNHKVEEGDAEYLQYFTKKWIQPTNLEFSTELPWAHAGTLCTEEGSFSLTKLSQNTIPQIDLVKVSLSELSYEIVQTILSLGYRPGLFLIRWDDHPDKSSISMITAGHLQSCGYKLMEAHENCFVYIFVDQCMYEICSWERTDVVNPMFEEYKDGILSTILGKKETYSPVEKVSNDVTPSTPTQTTGQHEQTS